MAGVGYIAKGGKGGKQGMVGSVGYDGQRHGGAVGVFETSGDGLWGEYMSDEYKHEAWADAWQKYRAQREKSAERDAYRAGWEAASMRCGRIVSPLVEGSIGWAAQCIHEGKKVKRSCWHGSISKKDTFFLSSEDLFATDWELAETPDSPCDSP
jgi:hypothetical protein